MMKKIVFLSLFMAAILPIGNAQFLIGGMVGANYSNLHRVHNIPTLDLSAQEMDFGYFVGVNTSFSITEKLNLLGDLKYTVRGYRYPTPDVNRSFKFRVNYFELVPKVEFRPVDFIGIAVGANLGLGGGGSSKIDKEDWVKNDTDLFTYDTNLALTGALRGYVKNFFIEAGYEHGITNIATVDFTDSNGESLGDVKSYFRNFNLGVGYLFAL